MLKTGNKLIFNNEIVRSHFEKRTDMYVIHLRKAAIIRRGFSMETLAYEQLIQNLIQEYANQQPKEESIETQIICDTVNHHYLLLYVGWQEEKRVYGCPIHLDIKDNKIWIHRDFTEQGIANQLVKLGVPKDNIVLAFRSPFTRKFTDLATA